MRVLEFYYELNAYLEKNSWIINALFKFWLEPIVVAREKLDYINTFIVHNDQIITVLKHNIKLGTSFEKKIHSKSRDTSDEQYKNILEYKPLKTQQIN